jgi:hypothetical protein
VLAAVLALAVAAVLALAVVVVPPNA